MNDQDVGQYYRLIEEIRASLQKRFIGQQLVVDQVLVALLSNGHVLLEGVPGLGKTLLVKSIAAIVSADFSRIQFTPDLMPADVTGHMLYDHQSSTFKTVRGPIFTNFLLADEINRSPAKTQAALLEVMEEHQVTLDGKSHPVSLPFMVLATQNPIEQEGTFALPEAQLDRFLLKIKIEYPSKADELSMIDIVSHQASINEPLKAVVSKESISAMQSVVSELTLDDSIKEYIVDIIRATRSYHSITYGAGPRGSIALSKAAKAHAFMKGRGFVIPDDVKAVSLPVLRHRLILAPEFELSGITTDSVVTDVMATIETPKK